MIGKVTISKSSKEKEGAMQLKQDYQSPRAARALKAATVRDASLLLNPELLETAFIRHSRGSPSISHTVTLSIYLLASRAENDSTIILSSVCAVARAYPSKTNV